MPRLRRYHESTPQGKTEDEERSFQESKRQEKEEHEARLNKRKDSFKNQTRRQD
ncbi:unnamed protein product [Musa acuminata subsp. burmannicoides]